MINYPSGGHSQCHMTPFSDYWTLCDFGDAGLFNFDYGMFDSGKLKDDWEHNQVQVTPL